jgi:hypothetical protein
MIYNSYTKFDDSAIRAVDALVDYTIDNSMPEVCTAPKDGMLSEYRFLNLKLPRRSGKSTYLLALNNYLNNKQMGSSVLITSYINNKLYQTEYRKHIYSLEYLVGFKSIIPFVLYDEVPTSDITIFGSRLTLSLYT